MFLYFFFLVGKLILLVLKGYLIGKEVILLISSEEKFEIVIGYCLLVVEYGFIEDCVVV